MIPEFLNRVLDQANPIFRLISAGWIKADGSIMDRIRQNAPDVLVLIQSAVTAYQAFHRLPQTGKLDLVTIQSLMALRLCSQPDVMQMGTQLCRWPVVPGQTISWTVVAGLPNFSQADLLQIYGWSFQEVMKVCGLRAEYNPNPKTANVLIGSRAIDQAGGVLGEMELPCGVTSLAQQVHGWFDVNDVFVFAENPPVGRIDLGRVSLHEIIHGVGVPHISPGNLMAPIYNDRIRTPQAGDAQQLQMRYPGEGVAPTQPPFMPPPVIPTIPGTPTVPNPSVPPTPTTPPAQELLGVVAIGEDLYVRYHGKTGKVIWQ